MTHTSDSRARVASVGADLPDHLLAVKIPRAAAALDCSRAFIYQMISDGRIRSVKIAGARRVPVSEIERLLAEGTS